MLEESRNQKRFCARLGAIGLGVSFVFAIALALSAHAAPRLVGVFVDRGSRGGGAVTWLRLASSMRPEAEVRLLDGADVRAGGLAGLDLLIMPGGHSGHQRDSLGTEGVEKVREYVRGGGRYFGTCAGLSLACNTKSMLRLVPYVKRTGARAGDGVLAFDFNSDAEALLGIKKGRREVEYHSGPQLVPSGEVPEFKAKVVATFAGTLNRSGNACEPLTGLPAAFFGDWGEGKIFATSFHPEIRPSTWDVVAKGIGALTGVKTSFEFPRPGPHPLRVRFFAGCMAGKEDARLVLDLMRDPGIVLWPMTVDDVAAGALWTADAVVLPGGCADYAKSALPKIAAELTAFLAVGGKVVCYGASVPHAPQGAVAVGTAGDVLACLNGSLSQKPADAPSPAATKIIAIAHRGLASGRVPQNTLQAFKDAYDAGHNWIETDFNILRNGRLLCVHDRNVLRKVSGVDCVIEDLTEAEIAKIDVGRSIKSDRPWRMPYIEDVLGVIPKDRFAQFEIKNYSLEFADRLDAAVKGAGFHEKSINISSFGADWLKDFKRRKPRYFTILLVYAKGAPGEVDRWIRTASDIRANAICPGSIKDQVLTLTRADADRIRAAGFDVRMWGVGTSAKFAKAAELGVTAVTASDWRKLARWAAKLDGVEAVP